ncbi:tyrosine-protein phosphatase non-receptor type 6 [Cordyceps fumosorosea ARSEF 2679]|uniref:protein-tyrosine-phosphatase n=1 Tax=Cordyceps fumosorosea (strain ARSEF 2679) TaxID=1081104 RepID=A0A162JJA2_CORFA|nr:tyrosine-protein phosphatase non-receptor type 6 [Cordyceps fumosorosea ARSEF 2679]OAA69822.1 tyrosine-protein phosphatase non-receptor type 6 [Cordyceps fumosorosea ARSEF 2679]
MTAHTARTPGVSSPHNLSRRPSRTITKSTTPLSSPRAAYSVGQNHPPRGSPGRRAPPRAPSPNYFGLVIDSNLEGADSSVPGKDNWSPAGSSIKSFAAALPKTVPLEPNSEFEAFKRQVDRNRGPSFALPTTSHVPSASAHMARPRPARWHSHSHEPPTEPSSFRLALNRIRADMGPMMKPDADQRSLHDSAYVSLDSKRNLDVSLKLPQVAPPPRVASPLLMEETKQPSNPTTSVEQYRDERLSLNEPKPRRQSPSIGLPRASTLPMKLDAQSPFIAGDQLANIMEAGDMDGVLLIDVRSVQNFSQSRIRHALNLCIPTTLLKRATFGIEKLQATFQDSINSTKFNRWRDMQWIIVYDTNASDNRDAFTAQSMIKKFTAANFSGKTGILRGGFSLFRQSFPAHVDTEPTAAPATKSQNASSDCNAVAPVIGGVMLPTSMQEPNPFFSNIRQNMDLADGVGQFDVHLPDGLEASWLPIWLRVAAAPGDHGKKVSDKFLHIEQEEQSRMRSAYAAFNPNHAKSASNIQLCGVEKGVKNRYKDILPFEHSRVRLENKASGCCDYVNASNLSASRSNKKYIATQGPLPATFEDFWSVVWDQDVRVIVMLTATTEGGQLKCHPYWEGREFGPIRLRPLSEKKASLDVEKYRSDSHSTPASHASERGRRRANTTTAFEAAPTLSPDEEAPYVIIRKFALSHTSHPFAPIREVTHLHFPGWPDFGTPAKPSHLLALVELANVMQRAALPVETAAVVEAHKAMEGGALPIAWHDEPEADKNCRPMLVHCSAGCGRTGAFCTVDSVVDMLKRKRQADLTGIAVKDAEGDVSMLNPAEMSASDCYFQLNLSSAADQLANLPHQQRKSTALDTRWLNDDSVDLIQKTVQDFRQQRLSTVQSLRQYVLCYETVLEWMHCMQDRTASALAGRKRSGSLTLTLPH